MSCIPVTRTYVKWKDLTLMDVKSIKFSQL